MTSAAREKKLAEDAETARKAAEARRKSELDEIAKKEAAKKKSEESDVARAAADAKRRAELAEQERAALARKKALEGARSTQPCSCKTPHLAANAHLSIIRSCVSQCACGRPPPAAIHSSTSLSSTASGIEPLSMTAAWKSLTLKRVPSAFSARARSSRIL